MTKYLWTLMICAALGVSSSACGADDDDDDMSGAGTGGVTSGSGGGGSSGSTSGSGGGAGVTSMTVMCGTATCTAAPSPIPGISAPVPCCANMAMNQCGRMMGATCNPPPPPPVPHPNCPGRMGAMGCCINGMCGQDATLLMMGCVENGAAKAAVMGLIPIPDPKTCDSPLPDPMMMDQDGGI
jgi:hypothetical protein